MAGRLLFFLIGIYAGVVANQRYKIPKAPSPIEAYERAKASLEEYQKEQPSQKRPARPNFYDDPDVKDIIDRLKSLEKKRRRPIAPSEGK